MDAFTLFVDQTTFDEQVFIRTIEFLIQLFDQYAYDPNATIASQQTECPELALVLLNSVLGNVLNSNDPEQASRSANLRNLLQRTVLVQPNQLQLSPDTLQLLQTYIQTAAVKMVMKRKMSDRSVKQIAML